LYNDFQCDIILSSHFHCNKVILNYTQRMLECSCEAKKLDQSI
jgi:hypothetical protein